MPSEQYNDHKRFAAWNYLGAFIVLLCVVAVIIIIKQMVSHKEQAIAKAKGIAEANRPVDAVNVSLLKLEKSSVTDAINLPGLLQAWDKATLSAQVSGKLIKKVDEGTRVKKDDPILFLDPSDYRIKLKEAKSTFQEAQQNYERKKKLRNSKVNALSELEQATATFSKAKSEYEAAELALERCTIKSPFEGVVDSVNPKIGELVTVGQAVAVVAQLGELKVEVGIPEKDIDMVRSIKQCTVNVEAAKVKTTGYRTYLSYLPADNSQVYTLRLKLHNEDSKMRPGMFGDVKVIRQIRENFLVPIYSVMAKDDQHYVFVAESYSASSNAQKDPRELKIARKKEVKLGVIQGTNIEVVSGLSSGEELVVIGQRNLDDGTTMNVTSKFRSISELSQ